MAKTREDLKGKRFGRLTVQENVAYLRSCSKWLCVCDCGGTKITTGTCLKSGKATSCGCYRAEKASERFKKHGKSFDPTYVSWQAMKNRCHGGPQNKYFKHYGGRGIAICDKWLDFSKFLEDMGERPSSKHSIDRIDVNGNYEPSNCRWATPKEQARNCRRTRKVTYKNQKWLLVDLAELYNIKLSVLVGRLKMGWGIEKALNKPVHKKSSKGEKKVLAT